MPDEEYQNAFGMTAGEIARILRDKFFQIICQDPLPKWEDLPASLRARWTAAVEILFVKCERQLQNVSAKRSTQSFLDSIGGEGTYAKNPRVMQIVWEAVLRHGINLVVAGMQIEPGENPADLRREFEHAMADDWHDWVRQRIEEEKASGRKELQNAAH